VLTRMSCGSVFLWAKKMPLDRPPATHNSPLLACPAVAK
jgi:hypothetical protein